MFVAGTRTSLNSISPWPCGASSSPNTVSLRTIFTPFASMGTRIIDCCWCLFVSAGELLPMKMRILQRGSGAPVVHHLRPLITKNGAVALDARLDVGRVRGGHSGLRHGEGRADAPLEERLQPLLLLLGRAVAHQHFHVAGVGRAAIERLRPDLRSGP
jgi:hypothetical protein